MAIWKQCCTQPKPQIFRTCPSFNLQTLLQVLDAAWDVNTGGSQLDVLIAEHLGRQFNAGAAAGVDVLQHPKAMAKLKKQVRHRSHGLVQEICRICDSLVLHHHLQDFTTIIYYPGRKPVFSGLPLRYQASGRVNFFQHDRATSTSVVPPVDARFDRN